MRIGIVGAGHVGLVMAGVYAHWGHEVVVVEISSDRVRSLDRGDLYFGEPGLAQMLSQGRREGRLRYSTAYQEIAEADVVVVTVGTPSTADGAADLSSVEAVVEHLARYHSQYRVIALKSTVPIGTADRVVDRLRHAGLLEGQDFDVVSLPEFLREGRAVADALKPERLVIGSASQRAVSLLAQLYQEVQVPTLVTANRDAEMIKYASNAFLAAKISFVNEIANICERVGVDVQVVASGMGLDERIGPQFLQAGWGYGGSCLPKDVMALLALAREHDYEPHLLPAVHKVNCEQRESVIHRLESLLGGPISGKRIAILGLAFKPNTDDLRESPALFITEALLNSGAAITAYDPAVKEAVLPDGRIITSCDDIYSCLTGVDAAVLVTEWNEFRHLDWAAIRDLMNEPNILDGRNALDAAALHRHGFRYAGIGRHGSTAWSAGRSIGSGGGGQRDGHDTEQGGYREI